MPYKMNGNIYLTDAEPQKHMHESKDQKIKRLKKTNAIMWKALEIAVGMMPEEKLRDRKYMENNIHWLMNRAREELNIDCDWKRWNKEEASAK